jgi:uncharacterized repeat protein (TIGR03803 family)
LNAGGRFQGWDQAAGLRAGGTAAGGKARLGIARMLGFSCFIAGEGMAGRGTSGMSKPIYVGLTTGKTLRLIITVILSVLACRAFNADAQTETNLHSFVGSPSDGVDPRAKLVQGSDGNFYGTTYNGGTNNHGIVFRISPSGIETSLYSFVGSPTDGGHPSAGLVQGSDGNFYGTTFAGGTINSGTVFRISPGGSYTNLYSFGVRPNDGQEPPAGLVQGSDGYFYGTTSQGGTANLGTVFRISPSGSYTSLYSFVGSPADGANPFSVLVQGSDSNFYGTTISGGVSTNCGGSGCGTVFRISPSGGETNLYSFAVSLTGGAVPFAPLVQGSDGNFYGTTYEGGTTMNSGTVFRISPSGSYSNLYSFGGFPTDGAQPAGLVQGSDGNFYGTTYFGGTVNSGTVFRISPSGSYTNLYSFKGYPNDGGEPKSGTVQGSDGNFYGTTGFGGANNHGTIFKLIFPLSSSANQISAIHEAGTNLIFNIPSIAYETYQLQFSSSMNPTNWVNVPVSVTNSIGALLTLTNFGGASSPQGFYRFDITP